MTVKTLKEFIKDIPDAAQVIFSNNVVTFICNGNIIALNTYGSIWDNGVGYAPGRTSVCGECTHFDCSKCRGYGTAIDNNYKVTLQSTTGETDRLSQITQTDGRYISQDIFLEKPKMKEEPWCG